MNPKLFWLISILLCFIFPAQAQQQLRLPRIGFLDSGGDPANPSPSFDIFRQELRKLGYVEGKNFLPEYRFAAGKQDRIPSLVTELVQMKVDVLVSGNLPAIRAAKQATKTIPIVTCCDSDC